MNIKFFLQRLLLSFLAILLWGCNFGSSAANNSSTTNQLVSKSLSGTSQFVTLDEAHGSVTDNSVNNSIYPSIVLKFVKPLNMATVTKSSIKLLKAGSDSPIDLKEIIPSNGLNALVVSPAHALEENASYRILVTPEVKSYDGDSLKQDFSASFSTGIFAQPTVALLDPNDSSVGPNPLMQIVFSESEMQNVVANYSVTFYVVNDGIWSPLQITTTAKNNNRIYTINRYPQDQGLTKGKEYYIVVGTSITDSSGAPLFVQKRFQIIVNSTSDLSVTMVSPTNGQENVSVNSLIELVFNKAVNNAENNILLHKGSLDGEIVKTTVSTVNRQNFVIKTASNLPTNTPIYLEVRNGVFDDAGATLPPTSFNFTTTNSSNPEGFSAIVISPNIQELLPVDASFIIQFNESANNVSTSTTKLIDSSGTSVSINITKYSADQYLITPKNYLNYDSKYSLTLSNQITNNKGSKLTNTEFSFSTEEDKNPPLAKISGLTGESYLSPRTNINSVVVEFSEPVKNVSSSNIKVISGNSCSSGSLVSNGVIEYLGEPTYNHPQYRIGMTTLGNNGLYHMCLTNIIDYASNKLQTTDLGFNTNFIKFTIESAMNYYSNNPLMGGLDGAVSAIESQSGMLAIAAAIYDGKQKTDSYFLSIYLNNQLLYAPVIAKNSDSNKHYHISKVLIDSTFKKIYLLGYSYTSDTNHSRIYLARYSYSANLEWTYEGSPGGGFYTDYRGVYQARGGFVDKSGHLYVVGATNASEKNIDSFAIMFDANGTYIKHKSYYPTDDNNCFANAAIPYDNNSFFIVGTTQKYIQQVQSGTGATPATKTDKDYEGYVITARNSDLEQLSAVQFGEEGHGDSGNVNFMDAAISQAGYLACPFLAIAGSTNYQFSQAKGSYKFANGTITDALLIYLPLDNSCNNARIYTEFGTASGSTLATAVAYSYINQTLVLAGVTTGALSGFTKISPSNNYEAFVSVKNTTISYWYDDNVEIYTPQDWYQYGATVYRTLQSIGFNGNNELFITGNRYSNGSTERYYISSVNQF